MAIRAGCLPSRAVHGHHLGALRWKAHLAAIFSWGVALLIAVIAFKMPIGLAVASSAHGFLYGIFPIVWILVSAIWMYQITVRSGRFDDLRKTFFFISDDPRVLGILIAFCFGGLLEALAGFGAPVAIAAAMLIGIGFGKLRAALALGRQHRSGGLRCRRPSRAPRRRQDCGP